MRNRDGFTLIELMVVVVIIGILAAIAIPKFGAVTRGAKESEAEPILKQIYTLQERFRMKNDSFATDLDALEGGAGIFDEAKYYTFALPTGTADAYIACATPRTPTAGIRAFAIDEQRNIIPYDGGCP
ncbi:MAG TPA: prepilin-type N-terminal cleavage/methylation domain-containing protein [Longimicrobium sp.]|jgi:prepilin-type N-terminal cleavage/methylation domain-containing protein